MENCLKEMGHQHKLIINHSKLKGSFVRVMNECVLNVKNLFKTIILLKLQLL